MRRGGVVALAAFACMAMIAAAKAEEAVKEDKRLFDRYCAICHAQGLTGAQMLESRLGREFSLLAERVDLDPGYVRDVVRLGINSMPPYTRVEVTDAMLDGIIRYLTRPREAIR